MLSPWTIYWVMQADAIQMAVWSASAGFGVISLIGIVTVFARNIDGCIHVSQKDVDVTNGVWKATRFPLAMAVLLGVASAFAPSTKTLCAALAIPMVVNDEAIQADVRDVYRLGMDKLKEVLDDGEQVEQVADPGSPE